MSAWYNTKDGILLVEDKTLSSPSQTILNILRSRHPALTVGTTVTLEYIASATTIVLTAYKWNDFPQTLYKYFSSTDIERKYEKQSDGKYIMIELKKAGQYPCHQLSAPLIIYLANINRLKDQWTTIPFYDWSAPASAPTLGSKSLHHAPQAGDIYESVISKRYFKLIKPENSYSHSWKAELVDKRGTKRGKLGQTGYINTTKSKLITSVNHSKRIYGEFISASTPLTPAPTWAAVHNKKELTDDELEMKFWAADKGTWRGKNEERDR